jgi:hypothetical protein
MTQSKIRYQVFFFGLDGVPYSTGDSLTYYSARRIVDAETTTGKKCYFGPIYA